MRSPGAVRLRVRRCGAASHRAKRRAPRSRRSRSRGLRPEPRPLGRSPARVERRVRAAARRSGRCRRPRLGRSRSRPTRRARARSGRGATRCAAGRGPRPGSRAAPRRAALSGRETRSLRCGTNRDRSCCARSRYARYAWPRRAGPGRPARIPPKQSSAGWRVRPTSRRAKRRAGVRCWPGPGCASPDRAPEISGRRSARNRWRRSPPPAD